MSSRALMSLVLLLLLTVLGGCAASSSVQVLENRQIVSGIVFDPAHAVVIEGDNGDIKVRRVDGGSVHVRADIRANGAARLAAVQVVMQTDAAGTLSIRVQWPIGWRKPGEAATLEVDLPGCAALTVNTGNGGIDVAGLACPAVLSSGNGEISLADHAGSAEISTSNGYVTAERVNDACRIRTSNGLVQLRDIGGRISVSTTNGAVEIGLTEDNPGPIDVRTANGGVEIELGTAFTGDLRLETFNGHIRVVGVTGEIDVDEEREWAVIRRGGSDNRSLIRTSNGRIEVRQE